MKKQIKQPASKSEKLAGKTVAFVGKFGYTDMDRPRFSQLAESAGAVVVDANAKIPDVLVVGEGRGGKPPSDVAKIQKKSPGVDILDIASFMQHVLPSPEIVLAEMHKGRRGDFDKYWENLEWLCHKAKSQIDLSKADLSKADLYGFHLETITLNGANLRGATTQYTHFDDLENVNFDGCNGKNVYLSNLKNCSFKRADLEEAWLFWGSSEKIVKCDFTEAKMNGSRVEGGSLTDCKFVGASLCDGQFEESKFERIDFSKADLSLVHAHAVKFSNCKFAKANLSRADLRGASLVNADLCGANLQAAVLNDADLTGADVTGADFQDAVMSGAKLKGVDFAKAKNFHPPKARNAGPKLLEFVAAAKGSSNFSTSAEVDLGKDEFAMLSCGGSSRAQWARSDYRREGNDVMDRIPAPTMEQGMINLSERWPNAKLRLDSITAKGSKILRGQKLIDLAIAAWAETFNVPLASPDELKAHRESQQAEAVRERDELMKKIRKQGPKIWNDLDYRIRDRYDLRGVDLSGAKLNEISMWGRDLKGAKFTGASLVEAELWNSQLQNAVFTDSNSETCRFEVSDLNKAIFQNANLANADFSNSKLQGADFSNANLSDAKFEKAQFDAATIFPAGFQPPATMVWKGDGPRPGLKPIKAAKAGTLDFDAFLTLLSDKVEAARMQKAGSMLKAERFQLFADVKDDSLVGIVKSQSDSDLVYSCRLTDKGAFGCCTQNLRPCGGLRGALCKHLLVLIVGLAKAGELDAATVDHWINLSQSKKPAIDEDSMSATFLRYKGAEAGDVDWRPTETIPEDFYTM